MKRKCECDINKHKDSYFHVEKDTIRRIGAGLLTLGYMIWGIFTFSSMDITLPTASNLFVITSMTMGLIIGLGCTLGD